jgi:hypothetical protein
VGPAACPSSCRADLSRRSDSPGGPGPNRTKPDGFGRGTRGRMERDRGRPGPSSPLGERLPHFLLSPSLFQKSLTCQTIRCRGITASGGDYASAGTGALSGGRSLSVTAWLLS